MTWKHTNEEAQLQCMIQMAAYGRPHILEYPNDGNHFNYHQGFVPPHYPVPAIWDRYPDEEYLVMLYERALLEQQLRDIRGETQQ